MTLQEWISGRGLSMGAVGKAIGTPRQSVHLWCTGKRTPTLYWAMAIQELTKGEVPLDAWLTTQQRLALTGLRAQHGAAE
jgi:hypothetical protein